MKTTDLRNDELQVAGRFPGIRLRHADIRAAMEAEGWTCHEETTRSMLGFPSRAVVAYSRPGDEEDRGYGEAHPSRRTEAHVAAAGEALRNYGYDDVRREVLDEDYPAPKDTILGGGKGA